MRKITAKFLLDTLARVVVVLLAGNATRWLIGDTAGAVAAFYVAISFLAGNSWLGALNFAVLQWFGVRLACGWSTTLYPAGPTPGRWWSPNAPPRGVPVIWWLHGFMWPLTGWWGEYRFLSSRLRSFVLRWPESRAEKSLR